MRTPEKQTRLMDSQWNRACGWRGGKAQQKKRARERPLHRQSFLLARQLCLRLRKTKD
jgi:hypothetical protein